MGLWGLRLIRCQPNVLMHGKAKGLGLAARFVGGHLATVPWAGGRCVEGAGGAEGTRKEGLPHVLSNCAVCLLVFAGEEGGQLCCGGPRTRAIGLRSEWGKGYVHLHGPSLSEYVFAYVLGIDPFNPWPPYALSGCGGQQHIRR